MILWGCGRIFVSFAACFDVKYISMPEPIGISNQHEIPLTTEEQSLHAYADDSRPTIPSEVTPQTPLESLNLNWRERDLPEEERTRHVHRLHPYLGKFIPELAEVFIRKFFRPGQTILDPFCGSGTTLVQANELGVRSIGYDISAFNVLLTRAKLRRYDLKRVRAEVLDVLEKLRNSTQNSVQLGLWNEEPKNLQMRNIDNLYLHQWYASRALNELLTYRRLIQNREYLYQDLLKVILSRSARSARLTTHYDLDFPKQPQREPYWCYKHARMCHHTNDAFKFLYRYSLDTLERVSQFAEVRTKASVQVHHADSRRAAFPPIHGVVTSPPYVGLIDYHDQHAYAYHLLGLVDRRKLEIGAAANGSSLLAKKNYRYDIVKVFLNALKSMVSGGWLVVVAHDSSNLYPDIASLCHVEEVAVVQRHVNRRTGRRSSAFYESVFIWRKP